MKYKNVLITGGAGFIGSHLAIRLLDLGYNVTVLDNLSRQIHGENPLQSPVYLKIKDNVKFIKGDVTFHEDWLNALNNQDAVIHLAAETGTGQSMYEIEKYCNTNILGTAKLWDILANSNRKVKKVIIASSRAIYGEGKYKCQLHGFVYPLTRRYDDMSKGDFNVKCPICFSNVELVSTSEDSKIHPISIYGFTKQAQEEISMIAGKSLGVKVVVLRYQNVYGPGQSLKNPYTGILSIFSTRFLQNKKVNIFEDGKESRDFVYIDDVVDATIMSLEKDGANYEIFNVGTGVSCDILSLVEKLKKNYNSSSEIFISGDFRMGDIRNNYADLTHINEKLGFKPSIDLDQGLKVFCEWVRSQHIEDNRYEQSLQEMQRKGLLFQAK